MDGFTLEQQAIGTWVRDISVKSDRGWHAFYHTKEWNRKRAEILRRDHCACQICRAKGRYRRADTVHHVRHLRDCPELALEDSNLVSLCAACHDDQHPEFRYRPAGFRNAERW